MLQNLLASIRYLAEKRLQSALIRQIEAETFALTQSRYLINWLNNSIGSEAVIFTSISVLAIVTLLIAATMPAIFGSSLAPIKPFTILSRLLSWSAMFLACS